MAAADERIAADSLVLAATNVSERRSPTALADDRSPPPIGDAVAARTAVMAIYEGRKRGMAV